MTKGIPTKLILLINKLVSEKDDSKKGDLHLEITKEVLTLNFVSNDIFDSAFFQKLTQLAVRDYLNPSFRGDAKNQIAILLVQLELCTVYNS